MASKKYYVVWKGKKTGVFDTWNDCKAQVDGFIGAQYKSFKSLELAEKAYRGTYEDYKGKTFFVSELSTEELQLIGQPELNSISVDAACSGNPGKMEYQGVDTKTKQVVFKQGPFDDATNNIGEFLALVHALAYMKKNNDNRPIYSDSTIAINWVLRDKSCRTKLEQTAYNNAVFDLIKRAEAWINTNNFTNKILKWETKAWGEIPADFGRK